MNRIQLCLARVAASAPLRQLDPTDPMTWEFSGFSQNGEDGIIDYLLSRLKNKNRYFVEIGSSDGIVNSTAWLALGKHYSGLMIEGDPEMSRWSNEIVSMLNLGVESLNQFVSLDNLSSLMERVLYPTPDFFSLDIDGNDYYIAKKLFELGLRPKICSVEYNSAFGPDQKVTIQYQPQFNFHEAHPTHLYYGVSVAAWREFFTQMGYRFVTVDSNGVNAFFCDEREFASSFLDGLKGLNFAENFYQQRKFKMPWNRQFELISGQNFYRF